ncbi:MAG: DUF3048 domain-containing protein [Christensenellales bacterium]|jgi:hypothetical protein
MKKLITLLLAAMMLFAAAHASGEQEMVFDEPLTAKSITTGLNASKEDQIVFVQFDNDPKARPQHGIASADIVYEIELYNGGYTRYSAVFNDNIPEIVEAVRSARIVNLDFYLEYGGCFVHFGGQQEPGSNIYDYINTIDMQARFDGLKDSTNFYRDTSRAQPYNAVFRMASAYDKIDWSKTTAKSPLTFSDTGYTTGERSVAEFSFHYRDSFVPSYVYNEDDGLYYRFYNGKEYKDGATGEQVTCANVIVQYLAYSWYDGKSDRPKVETTGRNDCEYFIDGTHFTGYWVRDRVTDNTVYYDDAGNEVMFKPGTTFVQTLKEGKEVTIAE